MNQRVKNLLKTNLNFCRPHQKQILHDLSWSHNTKSVFEYSKIKKIGSIFNFWRAKGVGTQIGTQKFAYVIAV